MIVVIEQKGRKLGIPIQVKKNGPEAVEARRLKVGRPVVRNLRDAKHFVKRWFGAAHPREMRMQSWKSIEDSLGSVEISWSTDASTMMEEMTGLVVDDMVRRRRWDGRSDEDTDTSVRSIGLCRSQV